jgi:hypothetical protein
MERSSSVGAFERRPRRRQNFSGNGAAHEKVPASMASRAVSKAADAVVASMPGYELQNSFAARDEGHAAGSYNFGPPFAGLLFIAPRRFPARQETAAGRQMIIETAEQRIDGGPGVGMCGRQMIGRRPVQPIARSSCCSPKGAISGA